MDSKLLLNLRHVPDDEAEEVQALLDELGLAWYRTEPNRWGISAGGIWLKQAADYPAAREALDRYQAERAQRARDEWSQTQAAGEGTLMAQLRANPVGTLAAWLAILFLLGLMALVPLGLLH